ncbi:MAG: hypothetical protein M3044_08700 [Thermoproteota archaeon]|nr:hypothetical protein [Thermoproteota archaeon]
MKTGFLFLLPVVLLGATPTATVFAHNDNQQQQACPDGSQPDSTHNNNTQVLAI